jgi:hypothetical protein
VTFQKQGLHIKSKIPIKNKQQKIRIKVPSMTPSDFSAIARKVYEKRKQGYKKKLWA